jgi:hypothetical protein
VNPLQSANGGGTEDAFVAKIAKPSAVVTLVPPNLDFGNQAEGITSSPQVSNLTNRGELTLTISSINVTGPNSSDFAQTNNCTSDCMVLPRPSIAAGVLASLVFGRAG